MQKFGVHSLKHMSKLTGFYLYLVINVGAALLVLSCYAYLIPTQTNPILAEPAVKILICSAGAMLLARSSFFQVKDPKGNMIDVGVTTLLKSCSEVIDKGIDGSLISLRYKVAKELVRELTMDEITDRLPAFCLAGLARFPDNEKTELYSEIENIKQNSTNQYDIGMFIAIRLHQSFGPNVLKEAKLAIVAGRNAISSEKEDIAKTEASLRASLEEGPPGA